MSFSQKSPLASSALLHWLPLLAFCAVIAHYFWFVYSNAVNIPHQDDIYDFLEVVNLIETADGTEDAFQEWFRQYNDHRTSASRLQVYGAYLVEGEVNFRTLTILANLALPLILLLFYLAVRHEKNRWSFLLVSALLLLHLRSHSVVLWSQPAFAYYYVYFYAFACLFALHEVTMPKFLLAVVLCSLATFTYAAGQVVWVLGFATLLHQSLVLARRSLMYPAIWFLVAVAMLMVWRAGFIAAPEVSADNSAQVLAMLPRFLIDPPLHQALLRYTAFFLVILGSAVTDSNTLVAGAAGFVMLVVLLFATVKYYKSEDIRLALFCWYAVASAAAVSVGRAMMDTPDYILDSRYSFLSVMLVTSLALLAQVRFRVFKTTPAVYLFVLIAGVYSVWAYRHFDRPMQEFTKKRVDIFNQQEYPVFGKPPEVSAAIVREAILTGIYKPPCRPFPECEVSPKREN